jgi:hypothetical protein
MPFESVPHEDMTWTRNLLGSRVTRLHTEGAVLTVVQGREGDVVPAHGYSRGSITFVVSGRIEIDGGVLTPGDAGVYRPGGYFSVKFLTDATYVVARTATDEVTMPDLGERSAHNLDA